MPGGNLGLLSLSCPDRADNMRTVHILGAGKETKEE